MLCNSRALGSMHLVLVHLLPKKKKKNDFLIVLFVSLVVLQRECKHYSHLLLVNKHHNILSRFRFICGILKVQVPGVSMHPPLCTESDDL